jgi:hypothetical protein
MNQAEKLLKYKPRSKPWPPGVSGNPEGRPKGALNKLSLVVRGGPLAVNKQGGLEQGLSARTSKIQPQSRP